MKSLFSLMPLTQGSESPSPWKAILLDIIDAVPAIVASFDSNGTLLCLNDVGRCVLGTDEVRYETNRLLSDFYDELESERIHREALPLALREGIWSGEATLRTALGKPLPSIQHLIAHRLDAIGRHEDAARPPRFTLVAEPIEQEDRIEAELFRRNRREAFAASSLGMIHCINNLLGPILTYTELTEGKLGAHPALHYVKQIRRAAERACAFTGRINACLGSSDETRGSVCMTEIVEEIVRWLRVEHAEIDFEIDLEPALAEVRGNEVTLHQAVLNIGRNAVEACADRGGLVSMALQSRLSSSGSKLQLTIRDDGEGISTEDMPHVFEPFFSTKPHRSGLGLSVSRAVVEAHGGTIEIESERDRGTVVTIELPSMTH